MIRTLRSKNSGRIWALASFLALLYFATSAMVVIRAFVWITPFPTIWYALLNVLYWPFQPYLDFMLSAIGRQDIPFSTYTLIARTPFLTIPLLVWAAAWRRAHFSRQSNMVLPNRAKNE